MILCLAKLSYPIDQSHIRGSQFLIGLAATKHLARPVHKAPIGGISVRQSWKADSCQLAGGIMVGQPALQTDGHRTTLNTTTAIPRKAVLECRRVNILHLLRDP